MHNNSLIIKVCKQGQQCDAHVNSLNREVYALTYRITDIFQSNNRVEIFMKSSLQLIFSETTLLLLLLLFGVRCARLEESENTLSVQRPQPHTTNPWKEEDKKERADHANRKALALLLKPASPTPYKGSLRSFQRNTERGTKILRY